MLGAATHDRGAGLSDYKGAVTHHIAADIDVERARLIDDLVAAGIVEARYQITGIGPTLYGRNGEGDRYSTDGEIWVARLVADAARQADPPATINSPLLIRTKDAVWGAWPRRESHLALTFPGLLRKTLPSCGSMAVCSRQAGH